MLDNKTPEQVAELFNRHATVDNLYQLFYQLTGDSADADINNRPADAIETLFKVQLFTHATMILDEVYQNPVVTEFNEMLANKKQELEQELMKELLETLEEIGLHEDFHIPVAHKMINPLEDFDKGSFVEIINQTSVQLTHDNPEKYRYNRADLPEGVQEHLDSLEKIILNVLHKSCSTHIFQVQIDDEQTNIVVHMEDVETGDYIFGFSANRDSIFDVEHYEESHRSKINEGLLTRIAEQME
jgi:hypothetical protein